MLTQAGNNTVIQSMKEQTLCFHILSSETHNTSIHQHSTMMAYIDNLREYKITIFVKFHW